MRDLPQGERRRLPVHPLHLDRIDPGLRARIFLERGYGERFGMADAQLAPIVAGVRSGPSSSRNAT